MTGSCQTQVGRSSWKRRSDTQLKQWESSHGTPQQVALRCRIILGALAGQDNAAIAAELEVSRPTVQLWRKRVREQGIGAVWKIAPGRGRKPLYDQATRGDH